MQQGPSAVCALLPAIRTLLPGIGEQCPQALLNERMAPDILEYREDLVARVKDKLEHQELVVEELEQQQVGRVHCTGAIRITPSPLVM